MFLKSNMIFFFFWLSWLPVHFFQSFICQCFEVVANAWLAVWLRLTFAMNGPLLMTATMTAPWFPVNSVPGSQSDGPFAGSQKHSWSFTMVTVVCMGRCFSPRHTSSQLSLVHFFQLVFTKNYLKWIEIQYLFCVCALFKKCRIDLPKIGDLWIFLWLCVVISKTDCWYFITDSCIDLTKSWEATDSVLLVHTLHCVWSPWYFFLSHCQMPDEAGFPQTTDLQLMPVHLESNISL